MIIFTQNTFINIIINDISLNETVKISSIFEIYKDNNKIDYETNLLILEKDSEYYFKYLPGQYELIMNFIPIYSNKFLEKQFYLVNEQNITINYDIEQIDNNQTLGLFFDYDEFINIKGRFYNKRKSK